MFCKYRTFQRHGRLSKFEYIAFDEGIYDLLELPVGLVSCFKFISLSSLSHPRSGKLASPSGSALFDSLGTDLALTIVPHLQHPCGGQRVRGSSARQLTADREGILL